MRPHWLLGLLTGLVTTTVFPVAAAFSVVVPDENGPLRQKAFRHPDLWWESAYRPVAELPVETARSLGRGLDRLGVDPGNAYFDRRTGRWGTLIVTQPLIPGSGVGNTLRWSDLASRTPETAAEREQAAWKAFRRYLVDHVAQLRIDPAELGTPKVTTLGERLIHIHVGRRIDGIPVRDTYVKATLNSGNLVLLGERNWGDTTLDTRPRISPKGAKAAVREHLGAIAVSGFHKAAELEIVPVSTQREAARVELGAGLRYRLVWALRPTFDGDLGSWEALVDAHDGELLSFQDTNHYVSRRASGSIFPVSNDGEGDDGTLQAGFPMPFADVAVDGEPLGFTSTGGNLPPGADTGTISTTLSGRYVQINDTCGLIDESAETGDLDLEGVPLPGTDCDVPPDHSPGDTNASRSGFYELNRLIEQARGYLPENNWLDQPLTANMNIIDTCNAFWNGSTVNFYTSGGGCANSGEIAAIFDHEWGHGMDNFNTDPTISSPGEAIADIFAQNRLNTSCIGRGFRPGQNCGGYGDSCTECTGVRESDWAKRQSGQPHGIDWILSSCPFGGDPCGRETHCEGTIVAEAVWDLVHRDFQGFEGSPITLDPHTALELGTRLSYYGSSNVGDWYQCSASEGTGDGCNADSGYLGYLAADDDNGSLEDGTPHMSALFAAFDRHQIACPSPTVQDAGCADGPTAAPANVTTTPLHEGAHISWDAVAGASEYRIFRTEGVNGCDFGKTLVATTTDTQFVESGLGNDFEVLYSVVAVGENDACASPMSACEAVTPVPGPGLGFAPTPLTWAAQTGDGDAFFDNCEVATLTFEVSSTGVGALTNVRIVGASIQSHAEAQVLTSLPATIAASLAEGATADGVLEVRGGGFAFDDTFEIEVEITADELAPLTFKRTYTLASLESDLEPQPSVTFSFEEGDDAWQLVSGTFDRTDAGGGAESTAFYRASSSDLNLNCDRIRSPLMMLTETSTLELYNQYDIEAFSGGSWWDRANVGLFDSATGERTIVSPDGGREYDIDDGTNPAPAPCASHQPPESSGWAGPGPAWEASSWTADALGAPQNAGRLVQIDVAYGTDPAALGAFGFWFDQVTVTDVELQVPDGQPDACSGFPILSFDPASLDFGEVPVGVTSAALTATLANTGDTAATGLAFADPGEGFEADAGACGDTLAAGASCEVEVTFTPAIEGPAAATLGVGSGEGSSDALQLAGNGVLVAIFEPAGLAADPIATVVSDGNGVFEPDELVVVAPRWRNDGSAAGALTGTADGFTGPGAATYTVVDDGADYGEAAVGDTVDCLDDESCYKLALGAPAVRPATLWEATFDESLSDGTTKTWTLHIGDSFTDVPRSSPFYPAIETLLGSGITGGCTPDAEAADPSLRAGSRATMSLGPRARARPAGRGPDPKAGTDGRDGARPLQAGGAAYCPGGVNTRSQMPVFVLRALEGAGFTPPACTEGATQFPDVPASNPFCPWIEELARRGLISGCGGGNYCPSAPVTRAQMAIFLLKTLEGADYSPPECNNRFDDVPCPSLFADWIEDLAAREITNGCSQTEYCPGDPVSRAQMAVFVTRTFGLTLYGP